MRQLLAGVRVLDLSRYISGPSCAQILGDLGAEVIKVEKKGEGDVSRSLGPWVNGASLYFPSYNRNKKSIEIDFRSDEGKELIKKLIAKSDVVVENFKAGTIAKMGISYDVMKEINPRIILASITGFGQTGPESARPAYDQIVCYRTHMYEDLGDGKFSRGPDLVSDTLAGVYTALSIGFALYEREKTGKGQWIDFCMLSASAGCQPFVLANYALTGNSQYRCDAPNGIFKSKDGYVNMTAGPQPAFMKIRKIIPRPVLQDEKYLDVRKRCEDNDILMHEVNEWTKQYTSKELDEIFMKNDLTGGIVCTWEDVLNDEQLHARGHFTKLPVKGIGDVPFGTFPAAFSEHEYVQDQPAPELGANTREIFRDVLGMTDEEIDKVI